MRVLEILYGAVASALHPLLPVVGRGSSKLARAARGQAGAGAALAAWAERHRDPTRELIWLHAPSVGEGLQARAVLEALKPRRPDAQWVFTHYSPSAEALAARMPVDFAGYLPPDTPGEMRRALERLRPALVVFTKTEVWPTLSRCAARLDIPTALIGATLPRSSTRRGGASRALLRPAHQRLAAVLAVGDADAQRLVELGVRPDCLRVTGDPGIDSAATRVDAADPGASWLAPFARSGSESEPAPGAPGPDSDAPPLTLVAGSTWPADETALRPALAALRAAGIAPRLVIAPHEPTPAHVARLRAELEHDGWNVATLSTIEALGSLDDAEAVIVDRVGVLADLYTIGHMAFVGGGFHGSGLHSVLEPAAAGLPVLFGPQHDRAVAAGALIEAGAAHAVGDADELQARLHLWITNSQARTAAAHASRGYIDRHRGAAARSADELERLLDRARPGRVL
jgi:3-deoxy-D-manno-octulosonic-acid transferase